MEKLGSNWSDFYKIRYLKTFQEFVEKIQVSLKSDNNSLYFVQRPVYIYNDTSLNFS
jgi:hypothetical protein